LVIPAFCTKSDYLVTAREVLTGSASYAKDFFSINLNLLFDLSRSSPKIRGAKFGERSQQLPSRRTSARLLPVEKPRWPLTGPVATHRPGVYSVLPSRHLPESCGTPPYYSRRTRPGRPRARGPIRRSKKIPLRGSREHGRRAFAFRPVTGAAENMFFLMEGFLHPSRCVLTQFRA
jgi:hypothetical protein